MSEIQQAAQSAKGLAKQFRSVLVVVEALENIGNLETAFEEITKRVREINELRVKAVDQRLIAEGSLKETLRKLDNAGVDLAAALSSAERVVAEAATAGETIVDEARKAANVVAEVSEIVNEMLSGSLMRPWRATTFASRLLLGAWKL